LREEAVLEKGAGNLGKGSRKKKQGAVFKKGEKDKEKDAVEKRVVDLRYLEGDIKQAPFDVGLFNRSHSDEGTKGSKVVQSLSHLGPAHGGKD